MTPVLHCHGNPLCSVSLCQKPNIPISNLFKGLAQNRQGPHMVFTLLIRLLGMDGSWLRQKLGISILIKTGTVSKLFSWQQHHGCHFVSFVMYISGDNFEEQCSNISRDVQNSVFYQYLVSHFTTSSVS